MNSSFDNFLQKQQELEYLKEKNNLSPQKLKKEYQISQDPYEKYILKQCLKIWRVPHLYRFLCDFFKKMAAILLTVTLLFTFILVFRHSDDPNARIAKLEEESINEALTTDHISSIGPAYTDDSTIAKVQNALLENDYEKARQLLTDNNVQTDLPAVVMCYVELYEHDQDYDKAADVMISYVTDVWKTQNIATRLPVAYTGLLEVGTHPLSDDVRSRYDACLNACNETYSSFESLRTLINERKYESALEVCKALKRDGTSDATLFYYFHDCYINLEKYEEYASYLIPLQKEVKKEGSFSLYLPLESSVHDALQEVYPQVSDDTRQQIDSLEFNKKYDPFHK